MLELEVAVGAIVESDEHLLLIVRGQSPGQGKWSLPGGRLRPGESMASAVEREVVEETGLEVHCGDFVGWVERISADYHFVILDFLATLASLTSLPVPVPADDAVQAHWVEKSRVLSLDLVDGLARFLTEHKLV